MSHGQHVRREPPGPAAALRHRAPGRPDRAAPGPRLHRARGPRLHRARWTCSSSPRPTPRGGRAAPTRAATPASSASLDERTLAFPSYDGNGMFLSAGNIRREPAASACSSSTSSTAIACGSTAPPASIESERPAHGHYPEAQLVVRVRVREVFPNCPRYIHQMKLVERSAFVPRARLRHAGPRLEAVGLGLRRAGRRRPGARSRALAGPGGTRHHERRSSAAGGAAPRWASASSR